MRVAILFITHDLSIATGFCHRVIVLEHGRVVEEGSGKMNRVSSIPRISGSVNKRNEDNHNSVDLAPKNKQLIMSMLLFNSGELRSFVNVYVNGDDIRFSDGIDTSISSGDEISLVPAVAGG